MVAQIRVDQFMFTHAHDITVLEPVSSHPPLIHIKTVGATHVLDQGHLFRRHYLAVMPADVVTVNLKFIVRRPTDP